MQRDGEVAPCAAGGTISCVLVAAAPALTAPLSNDAPAMSGTATRRNFIAVIRPSLTGIHVHFHSRPIHSSA